MDQRSDCLTGKPTKGNTLYLIRRDQRIFDNYAIELGYELSYQYKKEFLLGIDLDSLKINQFQMKLACEGLEEMAKSAKEFNLPLFSIKTEDLESFLKEHKVKNVILDYCPLRVSIAYAKTVSTLCKGLRVYCVQVDAHNIVPHNLLSVYKRTGKSVKTGLFKYFFEYLKEFKPLDKHKYNKTKSDFTVPPYEKHQYFIGGYTAGMNVANDFFKNKFKYFADQRNNPDKNVLSDLSPYLHLGQIASQKVVLMAYDLFYNRDDKNLESFVKEVFVWKETAEHFCYHEVNYDNINGALPWAKETLITHKNDKRDLIYQKNELEKGKTKSNLWNAAQQELVEFNKMHGYVRMFWAKQLLKWTPTPEEALKIAIDLNDGYSLDGNDPNGYLGIMWSICGSMDQGWKEREVIGKIRAMNEIKTKEYVRRWTDTKEKEAYLKGRKVNRKTLKCK